MVAEHVQGGNVAEQQSTTIREGDTGGTMTVDTLNV